ncbi:uncharacterized protein [Macrobrachium rosenbergii]|uniref:uncharacterized protein n=1 Tax=Macrobrachium rosenbergii TaxID=79674 RepID=UPI0034D5C6D0
MSFNLDTFLSNPKEELLTLRFAKSRNSYLWPRDNRGNETEIEHAKKLVEIELEREARSANIQLEAKRGERDLPEKFDLLKAKKLLPDFNEKDPEVFFHTFEDTANILNWPKDHWVMLVRNNLKGKAAYVASQMITIKDYDVVKKSILDAYSITVEGYRQNFRNSSKNHSQTFVEFCDLKVRQFSKWLQKAGVNDFDSLKKLMIMEEFLRKLPLNITTFILDKGETDLVKAASLADDYFLIHRSHKTSGFKSMFSPPRIFSSTCSYCKQEGHTIDKCPNPHCRKSEVVNDSKQPMKPDTKRTFHMATPDIDPEPFKAFTCKGSLNGVPVSCLRDTGSSQTIISVPSQDLNFKQEFVTITDLSSSKTLPLAEVTLHCPYYKGKATVAVSNEPLPCNDIQILIGNDIAGDKVLQSNLIVSDPEVIIDSEKVDSSEVTVTQIVTRSKSQNKLPETSNVNKTRIEEALDLVDLSKDKFVDLQVKDSNLKSIWKKTVDPNDKPKTPYYYVEKELLFRHYRSPKAPATNSWNDCYQLVIPAPLQPALLDLAHSTEAHLGVNKTYSRLSQDFSGLQTMAEFNIHKVHSSAYHPQTNGALERVHQTIKNLLRKYMSEISLHWDEDLDLLMYILRSVPHDTTGISPFELMFGRKPRTTLSMEKMSHLYDRKAKVREFKPDDLVLVYYPIAGAPLKEKYIGPYKILSRTTKVNYIIATPDRKRSTQLVHVNLLKPYVAATKVQALSQVITKYMEICTEEPKNCTLLQHDIILEPGISPIRQPYYRAIGTKLECLRREVQYLLDNGLAEPSKSPWASPCLLVPKANGQLRLCTDYRKLNKGTVKDSYPLPRINDILDSIGNSIILTQIDLLKGYYQIPLTDSAKEISAFITPFGLFSYTVMPFGLCNAPATFQRVMAEVIRDMKNVFVYLDDLIVASTTWEEHLQTLEELFKRLRTSRLTINLSKSSFGKAKVAPDFDKEFYVQVDASNTGYGAVLMQSYSTMLKILLHLYTISFQSLITGIFKGAQTHWATVEKELFAIISALMHFQPYLEGHKRVIEYIFYRQAEQLSSDFSLDLYRILLVY